MKLCSKWSSYESIQRKDLVTLWGNCLAVTREQGNSVANDANGQQLKCHPCCRPWEASTEDCLSHGMIFFEDRNTFSHTLVVWFLPEDADTAKKSSRADLLPNQRNQCIIRS